MKFVSAQTWPSIKRVIRDKGRHWAAAPYVSPGASKRLPLAKGDVLITRFDDETIRAGQTDPKEIVAYIRRGVEVHNEPYLHAKVYVSSNRAVICSANVSANSEEGLLEAGVEIVQWRAIADARRFVQEMRGAIIGLDFARKKIALFRSGGRGRIRSASALPKANPGHHLWIVNLRVQSPTDGAEAAARRSKKKAIARMKDTQAFRLDEFTFSCNFPGRVGDYVVQVVRDGRNTFVEAPAQILVVEPFTKLRGKAVSVAVEIRKRVRTRSLRQMDAAVRPSTLTPFPRVADYRRVKNDALRRAIFSEWPNLAEGNVAR